MPQVFYRKEVIKTAIFLISYDLNNPGQDYKNLIDTIKSYLDYCHALKSQWLIEADDLETADTIFDCLRSHIDATDYLFVCRIIKNLHAQLPAKTCKWLKSHDF